MCDIREVRSSSGMLLTMPYFIVSARGTSSTASTLPPPSAVRASTSCADDRPFGIDEVVGQDHGERFVTDHRFGTQHGVPEAQRLGLADVDE